MKIKKYVVHDMKEAIEKIKEDLGPEAVIMSQRMVQPPGILGLFQKKKLEVMATIDSFSLHQPIPQYKPRGVMRYEEQLKYQEQDDFVNDLVELNEWFPTEETTHSVTEAPQPQNHMKQEITELKEMIQNLSTQSTSVQGSIIDVNQQLTQAINRQLQDYDFCDLFKSSWQQHLTQSKGINKEVSEDSLYQFVKHEISRLICIGNEVSSKINVFVGPPGVGKTTTIAKIASNEIIYHQRKVGLITVDTYRIGAVEQLKTYATILNIPIKVVHNQREMQQAIEELQDCERIIIDSMGRTHRDHENLSELKTLFSSLTTYNCYLVLSMSTKPRQLKHILERYQLLNYNHLILTKLDESERNENILNICYEHSYPIAYLCTGQEVPTDIEYPSFKRILELVWGGDLIE